MRARFKLACSVLACGALFGCSTLQPVDDKAAQDLKALGTNAFGIKWQGLTSSARKEDALAVSDGAITLTARKDARAYIVHDVRATEGGDPVGFQGDESVLRDRGLSMLANVGVDRQEINEVRILQQFTQSGFVDPDTRAVRLQPVERSRKTLLVTRQVDNVPVISSRLRLHLDRRGEIALLELSWPDVPSNVREDARNLQRVLGREFAAPPMEGALVEKKEVVIVHSPAASFYRDMRAAIRVIYKPETPGIGKKPVRYLDANGADVQLPRHVEYVKEDRVIRPQAKTQ